jgi:hypothetical protein
MKKLFVLLIVAFVFTMNYSFSSPVQSSDNKILGPLVVKIEIPVSAPYFSELLSDCISDIGSDYVPGLETATPKCYCQQMIGGEKCNKVIECPGSYCWSCLGMIPEAR